VNPGNKIYTISSIALFCMTFGTNFDIIVKLNYVKKIFHKDFKLNYRKQSLCDWKVFDG
jgi:hypothetical protein